LRGKKGTSSLDWKIPPPGENVLVGRKGWMRFLVSEGGKNKCLASKVRRGGEN